MYIKEFGKYLYTPSLHEGHNCQSVGWLGAKVTSCGEVDSELIHIIGHYCYFHSINEWCGLHECELCEDHEDGGEWWFDWEGIRYVIPSMMLHYIEKHNYSPPQRFQEALRGYWHSNDAHKCKHEICPQLVGEIASQGNAERLKILLERGASGSDIDHLGMTPLSRATINSQKECIEILLEQCSYTRIELSKALHHTLFETRSHTSQQDPAWNPEGSCCKASFPRKIGHIHN